jgi:hypothetical protein
MLFQAYNGHPEPFTFSAFIIASYYAINPFNYRIRRKKISVLKVVLMTFHVKALLVTDGPPSHDAADDDPFDVNVSEEMYKLSREDAESLARNGPVRHLMHPSIQTVRRTSLTAAELLFSLSVALSYM